MRTAKFQRRPPNSGKSIRSRGLVKIGGEWLLPREARFLTEYLKHFNGLRAANSIGISHASAGVAATRLLKNDKIRQALRGALEERRDVVDVQVDEVARYWYDVATADPRELSQHVYVPCRYCWGEDHLYQFTANELQMAVRNHELGLTPVDLMPRGQLAQMDHSRPFDIQGGDGYTINRYPMRGPDWEARIERAYAAIGQPVPEGLEANSDHSCPECHGDGERRVWFADTRHLSPAAARLYSGVRVTRESVEIKTLDRIAAMDKFEQLTGMIKPRRTKFGFNLDEINGEELDALLDEARSRGLLSDDEIARGRLIDATPSADLLPTPAGGDAPDEDQS
jgi:phage terminase small subunit